MSQAYLPGFLEYWDEHAPQAMQGLAPPYLTVLPMPGFVQIWSGLLCATREDWSVLVRPLVNIRASRLYSCFEGLLESDRFKPFPLFMNIQLIATDVQINIPKTMPLFQVQPLLRATYNEKAHYFEDREGLGLMANGKATMSATDWGNYRKTIRVDVPEQVPEVGQYTVTTRKRHKSEERD